MNRLLLKLAVTAAAGGLLFSNPVVAQILPPQKPAQHVEITKGPELESAVSYMAIVRWTTTNPRGDANFCRRRLQPSHRLGAWIPKHRAC